MAKSDEHIALEDWEEDLFEEGQSSSIVPYVPAKVAQQPMPTKARPIVPTKQSEKARPRLKRPIVIEVAPEVAGHEADSLIGNALSITEQTAPTTKKQITHWLFPTMAKTNEAAFVPPRRPESSASTAR